MILVLHDITDLRRADQIRRDFVANVSHELRTPLTAIRGYVEALSEDDANPDEQAGVSRRSSPGTRERMERLVKDLLRLARLDAGQETLDIIDCDTRTLIQGVVTDLAPALDDARQRVELDDRAGRRDVRADPAKLHDALRNLVANAITYSPDRRRSASRRAGVGRIDDLGLRRRPGHSGGRFVARVRALLSRGQVAGARSRRHRPRPGHREAPRRAAPRQVRAENRPEGGARFTITLPLARLPLA